jgi:hypothetical protein
VSRQYGNITITKHHTFYPSTTSPNETTSTKESPHNQLRTLQKLHLSPNHHHTTTTMADKDLKQTIQQLHSLKPSTLPQAPQLLPPAPQRPDPLRRQLRRAPSPRPRNARARRLRQHPPARHRRLHALLPAAAALLRPARRALTFKKAEQREQSHGVVLVAFAQPGRLRGFPYVA